MKKNIIKKVLQNIQNQRCEFNTHAHTFDF